MVNYPAIINKLNSIHRTKYCTLQCALCNSPNKVLHFAMRTLQCASEAPLQLTVRAQRSKLNKLSSQLSTFCVNKNDKFSYCIN